MDTPPARGKRSHAATAKVFLVILEEGDPEEMARIVMKFGGTSVADINRIANAAQRVKREVDAGNEVAVVVSAMSGVTNQLVGYVQETSRIYDVREYDSIVASGEQVTAGLMALRLQEMGISARSWLGWQIPITTNEMHGKARIDDIDTSEIVKRFSENQVAVVAGFQGVTPRNRIATLRRIAAISIPMLTGSIPPTRALCRRREKLIVSPMKKCWKWRLWVPKCYKPVVWKLP